ncbi:hypothetical protein JYU34_005090 [Plutella xylostella]|uniref:Cyclin-like domain-containing protein n=1 Tax=Plutella xylostella TaxID=51655 RepID=A0ABQ7QVU1_PLUXY|nr:hypothetical protein JYU34_005090 [Plutella xylostella]
MEYKENFNRSKGKTRIPLPLDPLPPVPKHLTLEHIQTMKAARAPLRTLNQPNHQNASPGPSKGKTQTPVRIEAKNVTVRNKRENLDWNYAVFNDNVLVDVSPVINISDDESNEAKKLVLKPPAARLIANEPAVKPATPVLKGPLELNRIRNIKRSLKRPHSRELQGLSPISKERQRVEDEAARKKLNYKDHLQNALKSPDQLSKKYAKYLASEYTDDMFLYLQCRERKPPLKLRLPRVTRACVINWLMKVNGPSGDPSVMQAAIWYIDQVISNFDITPDQLQLIGSACYWIAQKLHQPGAPASRLVKCANNAFHRHQLVYCERKILGLLRFPPQPIISQDFITYLSWVCEPEHPGEIELAATFLVMSSLLLNNYNCCECPSAMAAAAVWNAVLCLKKKELIARLETCHVFLRAKAKSSFKKLCSAQRVSVRTVSHPRFEYKVPYEQYSVAPTYLAQRIIAVARTLTIMDTVNTVPEFNL